MIPTHKWAWYNRVRFHTINHMPEANQIEIVMSYTGPDVDNGKMSLDDLIPVLQGFGGAYSKMGSRIGLGSQHQLRITAIREGSTNLVLDVWDTIKKSLAEHLDAKQIVESATAIVLGVFKVIKLKKHVDNKPYSTKIDANNGTIQIFNFEKVSITATPDQFSAFKDGAIDSDLAKMVSPLERNHIDSSHFTLRRAEGIEAQEDITVDQRGAFDSEKINTTSTKEVWLSAIINSMTKSTNSGYVYLTDGTRVFYKLAGEHPEALYHLFSYKGPIKMRCVAYLDDSLSPVSLDVFEMIPEQHSLEF